MEDPKPISKWNAKDWKNFGIYILLLGPLIMFLAPKNWRVGLGFFLTGFVFTLILHGPRVFKIFRSWK